MHAKHAMWETAATAATATATATAAPPMAGEAASGGRTTWPSVGNVGRQLALPLDHPTEPTLPPGAARWRLVQLLGRAAPVRPRQVWRGLSPAAQARVRQTFVRVVHEALTAAAAAGAAPAAMPAVGVGVRVEHAPLV